MSTYSSNPLTMAFEQFQQTAMPVLMGGSAGYGWDTVNCKLTTKDKALVQGTFEATCQFLNTHTLGCNGNMVSTDLGNVIGAESFNANTSHTVASTIGHEAIQTLVKQANVPVQQQNAAVMAVAQLLGIIGSGQGNAATYRNTYLSTDPLKSTSVDIARNEMHINLGDYLAAPMLDYGKEAFGFNTDTTTPDIRAAITVTLLQFQRGVLRRITHTQPAPQPIVEYKIEMNQVYDLLASMDSNHVVRNSEQHQIPAINLLANAGMVSNTLKPIEVLKANDTLDDLVCDGWIRPGRKVCVFDLALRPNVVGYNQTDYSDLVAENVRLRNVLISLTKGTTTELFVLETIGFNDAKLVPMMNTGLSSDRGTHFRHGYVFTSATKTSAISGDTLTANGGTSVLLADMTVTNGLLVNLSAAPFINLMEGYVDNNPTITVSGYNSAGGAIAPEVTTLLTGLVAKVEGFDLDMKWSEENLRKSVIAGRMLTRTMTFEIPPGRNYLVDFSLQQQAPAQVLAFTTELITLGQDDRALRVITDEMKRVYDRVRSENAAMSAIEMRKKIGFDYVASQLVRPVVYMGNLDVDEIQNIRSSDYPGDVRQYVENIVLNLISKLLNDSYYSYMLNAGEKPVFRVVTSRLIMDNLFAIPHIHPQMQAIGDAQPGDGDDVEYRRVLASGVILEFACSTFDAMRDTILVIPYRASDPSSPLNWGINHDCGMFTANYVPQYDQGAWRRVIANSRSQLFPTNPIGLYINVLNASSLVDLSQVLRVSNTAAPFAAITA